MSERGRKRGRSSAPISAPPARERKPPNDALVYTASSGNVFADLGLQDADVHLAKARLVSQIGKAIEALALTQTAAAEQMGLSQPDLSKLLRGQFRPVSIERLMLCLVALGRSVKIMVEGPTESKAAKLEVA